MWNKVVNNIKTMAVAKGNETSAKPTDPFASCTEQQIESIYCFGQSFSSFILPCSLRIVAYSKLNWPFNVITGWQGHVRPKKYECETQGYGNKGICVIHKPTPISLCHCLKNTSILTFQLRSSRNFCIDIILLCIILGIAAYLYK